QVHQKSKYREHVAPACRDAIGNARVVAAQMLGVRAVGDAAQPRMRVTQHHAVIVEQRWAGPRPVDASGALVSRAAEPVTQHFAQTRKEGSQQHDVGPGWRGTKAAPARRLRTMALTDSLVNPEARRSPASGGNRRRARTSWRPLLLPSHRVVTEPAIATAFLVTRIRKSAAH